jgi:hypothetical protein
VSQVYFSAHQICLKHLLKSVPSLCIFLVLLQLTMLTSFSRTFVANSSRFLSILPQHGPTRFVVYMGQFFCLLAGLIVNMGKSFFCCSYSSVLQFLRLLLKIGETPCAVIAMMCGPCFFGLDEIPFARTEEMPFYKTSAKYKCSTQR